MLTLDLNIFSMRYIYTTFILASPNGIRLLVVIDLYIESNWYFSLVFNMNYYY